VLRTDPKPRLYVASPLLRHRAAFSVHTDGLLQRYFETFLPQRDVTCPPKTGPPLARVRSAKMPAGRAAHEAQAGFSEEQIIGVLKEAAAGGEDPGDLPAAMHQ
jgi:hypothetical protein